MTINYKDGSTLICSYIVLCGSNVIADDIYELNAEDIESIADWGGVTMDIEIYQLIQQVTEMARQAAIDKAAADVVELEAIGEWIMWVIQVQKSRKDGWMQIIRAIELTFAMTPTKR